MDPLMTSDEIAAILRVDVVTIRRLIMRGELSSYRVGSEYRFTQEDLEEYLERQRVPYKEQRMDEESIGLISLWQKILARSDEGSASGRIWDRFTERASKALAASQEEARRFHHHYIGTEHMLLGLLHQTEGVAAQILHNLGVELEAVRSKVELIVGQGKGALSVSGELALTRRAKKALELAIDEARLLQHDYIGTEHLLLGLAREGEGVAARVMEGLGASLLMIRNEALRVLREGPTAAPPPLPEQATTLLADGESGLSCSRCGGISPSYFRHCFNCGAQLKQV